LVPSGAEDEEDEEREREEGTSGERWRGCTFLL
jgi:hypothetical protein